MSAARKATVLACATAAGGFALLAADAAARPFAQARALTSAAEAAALAGAAAFAQADRAETARQRFHRRLAQRDATVHDARVTMMFDDQAQRVVATASAAAPRGLWRTGVVRVTTAAAAWAPGADHDGQSRVRLDRGTPAFTVAQASMPAPPPDQPDQPSSSSSTSQ